MKTLAELTDQNVLGIPGHSNKPPRMTARAIVMNTQGLYAVMYAEKFGLYSLPGGGIEAGEDRLTALRREILEETGCTCDTVAELGLVHENRGCHDFTQISCYYFVTTLHEGSAHLTQKEEANGTAVQWHTLEDMVRLIVTPVHTTQQRKFIQARDRAALEEYLNHVQNLK